MVFVRLDPVWDTLKVVFSSWVRSVSLASDWVIWAISPEPLCLARLGVFFLIGTSGSLFLYELRDDCMVGPLSIYTLFNRYLFLDGLGVDLMVGYSLGSLFLAELGVHCLLGAWFFWLLWSRSLVFFFLSTFSYSVYLSGLWGPFLKLVHECTSWAFGVKLGLVQLYLVCFW